MLFCLMLQEGEDTINEELRQHLVPNECLKVQDLLVKEGIMTMRALRLSSLNDLIDAGLKRGVARLLLG